MIFFNYFSLPLAKNTQINAKNNKWILNNEIVQRLINREAVISHWAIYSFNFDFGSFPPQCNTSRPIEGLAKSV